MLNLKVAGIVWDIALVVVKAHGNERWSRPVNDQTEGPWNIEAEKIQEADHVTGFTTASFRIGSNYGKVTLLHHGSF